MRCFYHGPFRRSSKLFRHRMRISKQLAAPYLLLEKYVDPNADPSRPFMRLVKV